MQSLFCYIVNSICGLLYRKAYRRFMSVNDIAIVQENKLSDIIAANKNTFYGLKYRFDTIQTRHDFQKNLPLTDYEDYVELIEQIKNGKKNILTAEDVILLELTSGSTSGSKYIPYTPALKKEFQCGIKPWIYNLYHSIPALKWGKSYWSITPATTQQQYTEGGIPVGFEEDGEYFGRLERFLMNRIFAVDSRVAREPEMEQFYFQTAVSLLKCRNLTFISVWNPSYLLILLDFIYQNRNDLLKRLSSKVAGRIKDQLDKKEFSQVWKKLKVISCWGDASAQSQVESLKKLFPDAMIQPKGLLATECFITFPLVGESGARLSIFSHFFEFENCEDKEIYLAHQLKEGEEYSLIVTTGGGLYRYRMHDIVRMTGFTKNNIPLFRFIGRDCVLSDLYGEKLHELFVKDCMEKTGVRPGFYMFAPESNYYVLYIKTTKPIPDIDHLLRNNFHYDYCRKLGQLKELKIFRLTGDPEKEYISHCACSGQRIGNIKTTYLSLKSGWDQVFTGHYENRIE